MNKIYQELLEIKNLLKDSGQKIDSVSNSNVANSVENQIQTQINNYSKKTFKSLINYDKEIKIKEQLTTKKERKVIFNTLFVIVCIISILAMYALGDNFISEVFQNYIYAFIFFFIFLSILLSSLYYVPSLISKKGRLKINDDNLVFSFGKKNIQIIYFKNIRSYIKENKSIGFSFFIYPLDDIYPIISFYVENIHEVDAIDNLLTNKINEYIEKEKNSKELTK
ncbi:hypothetical protein [Aliarcobacter butzleri]|uniref:hypothetical protein n=1 Tax=Aliarcobacter butzleri TaxID=28197 RepID=UPI001EDC600D|nr:hypothetical protein [Aliarcobacter butzleri]MCG3687726.1 hypothetical protein [Aliarcobacter butzleri]